MTNKEKYLEFCKSTYVPIYSKSWWMDAVCGSENWDVWIYESNGNILAAMPYYMERRGEYRYITKPPLTQHNGIIFAEDGRRKAVYEAEMQEEIIQAACDYIQTLDLDVYEQQYSPAFQNWSPFFWNNYTNITRYTYVIEDTSDLERVMEGFSSNYRKKIRKGQRLSTVHADISAEVFYQEHEKVFLKQGKQCPFSEEFWMTLSSACAEHGVGQMSYTKDAEGNITAILFWVWDERSVYQLLGGYIPGFSSLQSYPALIYHGISLAHDKGLAYDFEGSMIQRIAKSFREFGGVPKPYYRIRKVFNPEIVRKEAEDYIKRIQNEDNAN